MTEKPVTVKPDTSLLAAAAQMAALRIGSVVVMRDEAVAGVFTTHDALIALVHRWKDEQ
jgi:CBS domain-containing protein